MVVSGGIGSDGLGNVSLEVARGHCSHRLRADVQRECAMVVLAKTYCGTGRRSQRVMVGSGLGQSNHLLVRRRGLAPRETAVRWLPQLVGVRGLAVDLAVVADVARDVSDAADAALVVADHVRRPVVVVVHVVQVGLASSLHLAVAQPIDEEEEQGQREGGDHATGH